MKYIIKCINGEWWACTRTIEPNDLCYYERNAERKKVANGTIVTVKEHSWRTCRYVKVHTQNNDGSPREYVMINEHTTGGFSDYFAARVDRVYKKVVQLPTTAESYKDQEVSQETVDHILNPYPEIVVTLATLLQHQGDCWKDDCGVVHVDDIDTFGTATQIYELLKTHNIDFTKETFVKKDEIVNHNPEEKEEDHRVIDDAVEKAVVAQKISEPRRRPVRDMLDTLDGSGSGLGRGPLVAAVGKNVEYKEFTGEPEDFDPFDFKPWRYEWHDTKR